MSAPAACPPAPKKSLGQNFLRDKRIIQRILTAAQLGPEDCVLEIGAGDGCLTRELLKAAKQVVALEIDQRMVTYLEQQLADYPNLVLIQADALKYDYEGLFLKIVKIGTAPIFSKKMGAIPIFKLVANLPYYIATPLIQRFVSLQRFFSSLVLMLPAEVARRITANPETKDYGFFSILVQFYYRITTVCRAPAQAFYPQPKVDSLVLHFTPWETPPVTVQDEDLYWQVIKAAFSQRRKTLVNALQNGLPWEKEKLLQAMQQAGIDPGLRAEALGASDFARLADGLSNFYEVLSGITT